MHGGVMTSSLLIRHNFGCDSKDGDEAVGFA
jgi:hypothetical protein